MKGFARVTKLSNVGGRADYISNPDRQESIVAASEPVDWKPYQEFERANQKTAARNNEGREVVIALPNEWVALSRDELSRRAEKLAVTAAGKSTDMQWAVHWNKAHTNLHIHVIFSERQRKKDRGVWDRDIYLTEDGKVARRKSDRARNEDGSFKPPVHRKGEEKGGFTAKDPAYVSRGWVPKMKEQLRQEFARLGVVLEKPQPLHEYHEGKGKEAPKIRAKNEAIRVNNALYAEYRKAYPELPERTLRKYMVNAAKEGQLLAIEKRDGRFYQGLVSLEDWKREQAKPQQPFAALIAAQKEFYRQTYALHDKSKPLDPAQQSAPADLRQAFADLRVAHSREGSARAELSSCHFWQRDKKAAATAKLDAAQRDCAAAFDTIVSHGVSAYDEYGMKLSGRSMSDDSMERLSRRVDRRVDELQTEANYAARFARPADALPANPAAQRAARERFEQLCREVPPADRPAARKALEAAQKDDFGGHGMAAVEARSAVRTVTARSLPAAPERSPDRQQHRSRSTGHER